MDCHNRPSHSYDLPERGMDKAMAAGLISPRCRSPRRRASRSSRQLLSRDEAAQKIPAAFVKYYQDNYPAIYAQRQAEMTASAKAGAGRLDRNIFPEMKVTWGAYPINIGHTDYPGCFRCHDGNHNAKDGKSITQDCNACHNLLAMDEAAAQDSHRSGLLLFDFRFVEFDAVAGAGGKREVGLRGAGGAFSKW
jgi:hypothetical protein